MKRILVYGVSNTYGGIETFFMNVIQQINRQQFRFDFLTSSAEPCSYEAEIIAAGGENKAIVPWGENPKKHNQELQALLTNLQYDYVWINTASASKVSVYQKMKQASSATMIIHAHGASFESKRKGIKKKVLQFLHAMNKSKISQLADVKFATSTAAAKWLFGKDWEEAHIINNGIETQRFNFDQEQRDAVRAEHGLDGNFVLGHVGRLAEVKNHAYLFRIFQAVLARRADAKLLLIGSGEMEAELKQLTVKLGINEQVLFLGYQADITPYLFAMDAFVLPSFHEGLSIASVEAQATDLPCFLSDTVPAEVQILESVTFLSIEDSPEVWAERILETAGGRERRSRRAEFAAKKFDISDTAQEITQRL